MYCDSQENIRWSALSYRYFLNSNFDVISTIPRVVSEVIPLTVILGLQEYS